MPPVVLEPPPLNLHSSPMTTMARIHGQQLTNVITENTQNPSVDQRASKLYFAVDVFQNSVSLIQQMAKKNLHLTRPLRLLAHLRLLVVRVRTATRPKVLYGDATQLGKSFATLVVSFKYFLYTSILLHVGRLIPGSRRKDPRMHAAFYLR